MRTTPVIIHIPRRETMELTETLRATTQVDWQQVSRLVLRSRALDLLEEAELALKEVPYQFSAKGHELVQVLVGINLNHPRDAVTAYYRSRPFMLSVGVSIEEALLSGMGLNGGPTNGRDAGVMFNRPGGVGPTVFPTSGDVGSQYTPAAGWAQACRYRAEVLSEEDWFGAIAVAMGGDGSVATNGFWSALTMATTLRLPLLLVIEDNGYGISVPNHFHTPGGNIADNLASFANLKVLTGSGSDPEQTSQLVLEAISHVRSWEGPCLLHMRVPRLMGHTFIDNQAYRSEEEIEHDRLRDPVAALEAMLGTEDFQRLKTEAEEHARESLERARAGEAPDSGTTTRGLFFEGELQQVGGLSPELGPRAPLTETELIDTGPRINLIDAVRKVMEQELEANPRAIVFGEDVGAKGGVHGATVGMQSRFGDRRVFDTSLSEEGIIGRSIGMAYAGLLPLPEIQFRKYADPAFEQINDIGIIRWRTAGRFAAPMVVRIPVGYGRKVGDPWHAVSGEATFAHSLGWRLAYPANAADAAGLLRTALRSEDPTLFFEHRALLDAPEARRPDPGPDYALPFGRAAILATGDELTLITWGGMVYLALEAAERFPDRVEVIDLRTISPWDQQTVLASVRKTGRCLVVHEDTWTGGFGGEILATIAELAFEHLDAPLRRLTMPDCPIPYSPDLLASVLPSADSIASATEDLLSF